MGPQVAASSGVARRIRREGKSPELDMSAVILAQQLLSGPTEVVRMPRLQARPLGGGTSLGTRILLAVKSLRPAARRVLPHLLPPIDGQVKQPIAVIHRLDAAPRRPVSLEDIGSV